VYQPPRACQGISPEQAQRLLDGECLPLHGSSLTQHIHPPPAVQSVDLVRPVVRDANAVFSSAAAYPSAAAGLGAGLGAAAGLAGKEGMGCVSGSTAAAGLGVTAGGAGPNPNPNAAMGPQGAVAGSGIGGGDAAAAAAAAAAFGEGSGGAGGRERIHLEIKPADTLHLQMTPRVSLVKKVLLGLPARPMWLLQTRRPIHSHRQGHEHVIIRFCLGSVI
jgi:hypothetical protein